MPLFPLQFPPGILRNGTAYQRKGRWHDGNLIRFLENTIRPVGGWEPLTMSGAVNVLSDTFTDTTGVKANAHTLDTPATASWVGTAAGNGGYTIDTNTMKAVGTIASVLEMNTDEDVADIEDNRRVSVIITRPTSHGSSKYAGLRFRANSTVSGAGSEYFLLRVDWPSSEATATVLDVKLVRYLNSADQENSTVDAGTLSFPAGTSLEFSVVLDGGDITAYYRAVGTTTWTALGSTWTPSADYNDSSHERIGLEVKSAGTADANAVYFDTLTAIQTISLSGTIRALVGWRDNANGYSHLAMGTEVGLFHFSQGNLSDISPSLTTGSPDTAVAVGPYGSGYYGLFNYGEGDPAQGTEVEAATWQLDTFGDYLVGVLLSDGKCWYWDLSTSTATQMTESPTNCKGIVVTPERFIFALGSSGNPRQIEWATQEGGLSVSGDWTPASTNTAGSFILPGSGVILCGRRGRNETLIFTDEDLFAAQYIGGTLVYAFKQLGSKCGIIARHAVAVVDGKALWMGQRSFFLYDGFVRSVVSDVSDYVFSDFNRTQRAKCFAVPLGNFGEVWFFYPSSGSNEPDRYVIWNYREQHWSIGQMSRTAGIDRGAFSYPLLADGTTMYEHERGSTHDGAGTPYIESAPQELGSGDQVMMVRQLVPDEATQAGQVLGSLNATLYSRLYPTDSETTHGPYTLANPTSTRFTARQVRLRASEISAGDWRLGTLRVEAEPGSER